MSRVDAPYDMEPLRWKIFRGIKAQGGWAGTSATLCSRVPLMAMYGITSSLCTLLAVAGIAHAKPGIADQISLLQKSNASFLQYPTQFTQGIIPKPIHSHNDYWRDVPLLSALSFGVASVEADVWFVDGKLYVGHDEASLTPNRTFESVYLQPLLEILNDQNPDNKFTRNQTRPNGVFDVSPDTPLQLLVDMKTDGKVTLQPVLKALQPLRAKGYLSTFANGTFVQSSILVVGTGNTPLDDVKALEPRDLFFDGPLTNLNDTSTNWEPTLAPLASTDFQAAIGWGGVGTISDEQLGNLTQFIADADARGIKSRFWNTPAWPVSGRNAVWRLLRESGAFWLNADDILAASQF
ncbi:hypothetical protein HGRIS_007816 [Hohenbuehelia grisea]|uniref:Altered inheritance of mitochondria protein 6 n=1 Tax=Hohenbuehelia grisea TaxID=104357 RepID=A0ABR3J626_9AGAR